MSNYSQLIFQYQDELNKQDIPFQTARVYLYELCNEVDFDIYMNNDVDVPQAIEEKYHAGMARILKHEPMNYVLGYSWFYGYKILTNSNVLIPRYETEELVANVLGYVDEIFADKTIVNATDIGTGSGAIAIALTKEDDRFRFIASDISADAVGQAQKNAALNEANIEFTTGNMLDPLIERNAKVDVLLCNPPYIPQSEVLDISVKDYEPNIALFGGEDGLKYYKEVFENAHKILNDKYIIGFEIGYDQKNVLEPLAKAAFPQADVKTLVDINGKDRMLFVIKK